MKCRLVESSGTLPLRSAGPQVRRRIHRRTAEAVNAQPGPEVPPEAGRPRLSSSQDRRSLRAFASRFFLEPHRRGILVLPALWLWGLFAAEALELATGFCDFADPDTPETWITQCVKAAESARGRLKSGKADVVMLWDNLSLTDAEAQERLLPALSAVFPGATFCGKRDRWRWFYSPFTERGAAVGRGLSLLAVSGVKAKVVHVASGDSDAAKKEDFLAHMETLGRALGPLPEDARLLVVMGAFHGKGAEVAEGLRRGLSSHVPVVGGSAGGVGSIYQDGKVINGAVQAVLLSGDFRVHAGLAPPMGDWVATYTQEGKAAAEAETLGRVLEQARAAGHRPLGFIWFNCQGRCEQPGSLYQNISAEERQARRALHHGAVRKEAGDLPFWGHFSGAEVGVASNEAPITGGGYLAAFAVLAQSE